MSNFSQSFISEMVAAYLECAAWSTAGLDGEESLEGLEYSEEAQNQARVDCESFLELAMGLIQDMDAGQCGHDFWLTREGHGVGFWDRSLGKRGDKLTDVAEEFGGGNLYRGDDNLLYFG